MLKLEGGRFSADRMDFKSLVRLMFGISDAAEAIPSSAPPELRRQDPPHFTIGIFSFMPT
jgi:hypothetical protein